MAKLYPTDIPQNIPDSETQVLRGLSASLDDDYLVFWSVKMLGAADDGTLTEGEADVVLLHPKRGLLVLEVKGGRIRYNGADRQYYSQDTFGREFKVDDPYGQADRRKFDLIKKIIDRRVVPAQAGDVPFVFGHAVIFPDSAVKSNIMALDAAREITLDSDDMDLLRDRIERVYRHWGLNRVSRELTKEEVKSIRDRVLMPSFELAYSLTTEMNTGERLLRRMMEEQCRVLDLLDETDQALVRGSAGTGKTYLLMEKARRLTQCGKTALVLCFNKPLSKHLASLAADMNVDADVMTFHHLCRLVIESSGQVFEPDKARDIQEFWRIDAPDRMCQCLGQYAKRYDAVLVDEGQDFDSLWWQCVDGVFSGEKRTYYIFFDPLQKVYSIEQEFPFDSPVFPIKDNCRNTKNIGRLLQAITKREALHVLDTAPPGRAPVCVGHSEASRALQTVDRLVDHLTTRESIRPEQITILSPHRQFHSVLCGRAKVGRQALIDVEDREAGSVGFSTIRRFKGLESDVVIVVDVTDETDGEQLYTGMSRAKHLLYIIHDGSFALPCVEYESGSKPSPMPA